MEREEIALSDNSEQVLVARLKKLTQEWESEIRDGIPIAIQSAQVKARRAKALALSGRVAMVALLVGGGVWLFRSPQEPRPNVVMPAAPPSLSPVWAARMSEYCRADPPPSAALPGGLVVRLEESADELPAAGSVDFTIILENVGDSPVTYSHSEQRYEFWVRRSDGSLVWRWSAAKQRSFDDFLKTDTLAPGSIRRESVVWKGESCHDSLAIGDRTAPGTYTVQAAWYVVSNHGVWWTDPATIEVK